MSRLRTAFFSGAGAASASVVSIMLLSKAEGNSVVRPINASSHLFFGPADASRDNVSARHTIPGIAINTGAAFFWGAIFASLLAANGKIPASQIVTRALATTLAAAALDYGLMPRRLRPGWELVLKARSVVVGLAAMGVGLAAGGFGAQAAVPIKDAERVPR
jgi:hypothetical protein